MQAILAWERSPALDASSRVGIACRSYGPTPEGLRLYASPGKAGRSTRRVQAPT
ncbi:hypothetical protein ACVLV4_000854 [Rathayibacter agropyri]